MIAPVLAFLLFAPFRSAVVVDVDVKDKDIVAGERKFRVSVQSEHPVTQVEFYVGDDLRDSDTSTPYEFKFNALEEKEGPLKLTFAAYTSEGESAKKVITVTIDNSLGKGAEFHVAAGEKALSSGKLDDAISEGRIALKIKPTDNGARMVLARAYFQKGVTDQAQKFIEDVLASEPNNGTALELKAGIQLQAAFTTYSKAGTDKKETLATIRGALVSAAESRRKNLEAQFAAMASPTDATMVAYADSAIRSSHYSAAINALQGAFNRDPSQAAVSNRLAYSQLRLARLDDAKRTLSLVKRKASLDAYGSALLAVVEELSGNSAASDDAITESTLSDSEDLGGRTAQVYIALRRMKLGAMGDLVKSLAKDAGPRTETNYYLSTLFYDLSQFSDAQKRFEMSVLAEPANYDMYLEKANEALVIAANKRVTDAESIKYQYAVAQAFLDAAFAAKPDAPEVLVGLAITNVLQGKPSDSLRFGKAAADAGPTYAAAQYVYSMVAELMQSELNARAEKIRRDDKDGVLDADQRNEISKLETEAKRLGVESKKAINLAVKLDAANLDGRPAPTVLEAFSYFYRYGRLPLLTAPR